MSTAGLTSLYGSQPLFVWVEDEMTRVALATAWAGDPIAIHVGGSNDTIRAAVNDAWRNKIHHVFGVVDRDHFRSNFKQWLSPPPDLRVYVLESPEIETLALDSVAMAECDYNTAKRTPEEIESKLNDIARSMNWWMACCSVMMIARERRNLGFPSFPPLASVTTEITALEYISKADWFAKTAPTLPELATADWILQSLQGEETRISSAIAAGTWRTVLSGKEVLRQVVDYIYRGSAKNKDMTLLQAIVERQRVMSRIPAELSSLRSSLRSRVGMTS